MLDLTEVRAQITSFDPGGVPSYESARTAILALLDETGAPSSRDQFAPGHLTASGIVLSPRRDRVLLVHHRRLDRWLQPGGHIEDGDANLLAAARREVIEETAADLDTEFQPILIGMDVHEIPAARGEPDHLHHDVLFAFIARSLARQRSEESHDVHWAPVAEIARFDPDPPLERTLRRSVEILRARTDSSE